MGLLANIYNQQQAINQQPTSVVRTPVQTAYDNYLNAQANAQDTAKQEWGSAIGNSVNGLAKIIASSVIGNPIEKAASTRNLDNFDARQDELVRQWAMEQAKKRNDFVNQAKEQLGMAKADEEQDYERELTANQIAYKKAQDLLEQQNKDRQFNFAKENADRDYNLNVEKFDWTKDVAERDYNLKIEQLKEQRAAAKTQAEKDAIDLELKQQELEKKKYENSEEYKQQQQYEKNLSEVNKLIEKKLINASDGAFLLRHPEAYKEIESRVIFSPFRGKYEIPSDIIAKYDKKERQEKEDVYDLNKDLTLGDK